MKKLMTVLASAATALFAFSSFAVTLDTPSGTSFEDMTEGPKTLDNMVQATETYEGIGGRNFWLYPTEASADEVIGYVTNYVGAQGANRPDKFKGELPNDNYLALDTSVPITRTILPNNVEAIDYTNVVIGTGIYLDTLVKFSAADEVFGDGDVGDADKLALSYVESDTGITNIVVRAGYVEGSEVVATNYILNLPAGFNKDDWHRLTIRVIEGISKAQNPVSSVAFIAYLDGNTNPLTYDDAVAAGDSAFVNDLKSNVSQNYYTTGKHALLPSLLKTGRTGYNKLTGVAFQGNGYIDDLSFGAGKPDFVVEGTSITVSWDDHVTSVVVMNGETELLNETGLVGKGSQAVNIPNGVSSVTVTATYATGYLAGVWNSAEGDAPNGVYSGFASGSELKIDSIFPTYQVGENVYGSFEKALEAATGTTEGTRGTIKLLTSITGDYEVKSGFVTIDLAGNNITAETDGAIINDGANLFITNSTETIGHVIQGTAAQAVNLTGGATTIFAGIFDGEVFVDYSPEDITLYGGRYLDASAAESTDSFYLKPYVPDGTGLTYRGSNYFEVGGSVTPPTTYALTVTVPDHASVMYAIGAGSATAYSTPVQIEEGSAVTVTATPASGYTYTGVILGEGWTLDSLSGTVNYTIVSMDAAANLTAPAPEEVPIGTYNVTVTPTENAVYSAVYKVGGAAVTFVENVASVTVGQTITITATPNKSFEYATAPDGWTLSEGVITKDVSAAGTVAIPAPTGKYPSWVDVDDDAQVAKYTNWATYAGVTASEAAELYEAYLLNCKADEVPAAKAAFKFTAFDPANPKDVSNVAAGYNERTWNGTVTVKQYSDVGCKTESESGKFFRAVLN